MFRLPDQIHIPHQLRLVKLEWTFGHGVCYKLPSTHYPLHTGFICRPFDSPHTTRMIGRETTSFLSFASASTTSTAILLIPSAWLDCIFTQPWDGQKVIFTFTSPHVYNRHFTILYKSRRSMHGSVPPRGWLGDFRGNFLEWKGFGSGYLYLGQ